MAARNVSRVGWIGSLCVLATLGCRGSEEDFKKYMAEQSAKRTASEQQATAKQTTSAPAAAPLELETKALPKQKASILAPKTARVLVENDSTTKLSQPIGKAFALDITVSAFGAESLDAAKKQATTNPALDKVESAEEKDGAFVVVLAPRGQMQALHVFRKSVSASCSGPKDRLDELVKICSSLSPQI